MELWVTLFAGRGKAALCGGHGRGDRGAAGQALRPGVLRPVPGGGARRHRALADRAGGGKDHLLRLRRDLCRPAGGD